MCYYISIEGKKPCYLVRSFICTRRKKIDTEKEYVNYDATYAPELEETELGFLNKYKNPYVNITRMIQLLHRTYIQER